MDSHPAPAGITSAVARAPDELLARWSMTLSHARAPPRGRRRGCSAMPNARQSRPHGLVVGADAVPQREATELLLAGLGGTLGLRDEEGRHARRVDDQQRVTALVAVEDDPVLTVAA